MFFQLRALTTCYQIHFGNIYIAQSSTCLCHLCWASLKFSRSIASCDHPTEKMSLYHSSNTAASLSSGGCTPWPAVYRVLTTGIEWAVIWSALCRWWSPNGMALRSTISGLLPQMNCHTLTNLLLNCIYTLKEQQQCFQYVAWRQTARWYHC